MTDRKRLLVVGVGSIGERHLRCFQATNRVDVSICELNDDLCEKVAAEYGVERQYADLETALADPHDCAVIATPAHLHIEISKRAVQAGLDLFIEKPLSTNFQGINELQSLLQEKQKKAAIAYVYRAHPALAAMKAALDSGKFGKPVQLVVVSGQHFPTYRPAYRDIYYKSRETGGGAVQDALTHSMNAGEYLVGPVESLVADFSHQVLEGVDVEDTVHVITRQGGVLGSFSLNQHQPANESRITVICERGMLRFEFQKSWYRWITEPDSEWQVGYQETLERDTLFQRQATAFLDYLDGLCPPLCTLEEGAQTLAVNLSILDSVEHRSWIEPAQFIST
ncbi:Gfo/Idh/MocA family oxidoreductase [uncultured Gimesia sp.]|uniref:Gfo/Idh/MocA family protein n=1 Tax=uncultured Gimesia sp. TaxID=1678688 RepID=UPI0030D77389|tara:strand:- start:63274 stop:64287 length:1014 start_codon:yes stop_codon:yes gene_type:complete